MNQHTEGAMIAAGRSVSIGDRIIGISPDRLLFDIGAQNYIKEAAQDELDMRRIAACFNSCAEFSTEDLENSTTDKRHRALIIADLTIANKRCDELLAALKSIADETYSAYPDRNHIYGIAHAAIAKAEQS